MKRMHIHLGVADLDRNVRFYSQLFGSPPTVLKGDYAKWMLDDPRVNFAISTRAPRAGLDHLGLQVESDEELAEVRDRLVAADVGVLDQPDAQCCYAQSNKHWTLDPQGVAWETFHSLQQIPVFGADRAEDALHTAQAGSHSACCAPSIRQTAVPAQTACCTPAAKTAAVAAKSPCCG